MLRLVLRANAASCAIFGAIFALLGGATAAFLGNPPVLVLQILGVGLMANAVALAWTSLQDVPDRSSILVFALGDFLWVAATIVILIGGFWVTTAGGIAMAIGVAVFVGACGVLQWKLAPTRTA